MPMRIAGKKKRAILGRNSKKKRKKEKEKLCETSHGTRLGTVQREKFLSPFPLSELIDIFWLLAR